MAAWTGGDKLLAVCPLYSPFIEPCAAVLPSGRCVHPGLDVSLFLHFIRTLGWTHRLRLEIVNSYPEMRQRLINGTADFSCASTSLQPQLVFQLGYTLPVYQDQQILVVKAPVTSGFYASNLVLSILSWRLVLLIAGCLAAVLFLRLALSRLLPSASSPGNAAFTAFALVLSLILGTYTNFLSILFSQHIPPAPVFRSVRDLALRVANGDCRFILPKQDPEVVNDIVLPNHNSSYTPEIRALLRRAFESNPPEWVEDAEVMVERVLGPGCAVGIAFQSSSAILNRVGVT